MNVTSLLGIKSQISVTILVWGEFFSRINFYVPIAEDDCFCLLCMPDVGSQHTKLRYLLMSL